MNSEEYLDFLRSRGRKETTIESYRASIRVCERCLEAGGFPTDPEKVNEESFYYLRTHLDLKETSMQTRMRAYSQYIEHITGKNYIKRAKLLWNPLSYDVQFISREQYNELLCFSFRSPHIRMMLLLGGLMGLRRTEMASIKMEDLGPDSIRVHGKGHGEEGNIQIQHVPKEMQQEVRTYLKWRKEKLQQDNVETDWFLIFTEKYGHVSLPKNRKAAVSWTFAAFSERAGIEVTPHSLRRLYATTLYNSGVDIKTIAKLMRHANPMVTWRYIQQNEMKTIQISDSIVSNLGLSLNTA